MDKKTYFSAFIKCKDEQYRCISRRPRKNFGIWLDKDEEALRWQKLERISEKLRQKIVFFLEK